MDVKKQIVFIVNPKSGLLDKQQILNWIEKRLNQDIFEPTFFHTEYAGHASEIAAHAARKGIFAVIAIKGTLSIYAVAKGVTKLVAPGPLVAITTPTFPLALA